MFVVIDSNNHMLTNGKQYIYQRDQGETYVRGNYEFLYIIVGN